MNYTDLLTELNQASLFDLFRLSAAINKELENPNRLTEIKKCLNIGMEISYFNSVENKLVLGKLLAIRPKTVLLQDLNIHHHKMIVPYYMLNVDNVSTDIYQKNKTDILTANNLQVGESVGFHNKGHSFVGIIKSLNQKTVTLVVTTGEKWRVHYSHLHRIYNAEVEETLMLESQENVNTEQPTEKKGSDCKKTNNSRKNRQKKKKKRRK